MRLESMGLKTKDYDLIEILANIIAEINLDKWGLKSLAATTVEDERQIYIELIMKTDLIIDALQEKGYKIILEKEIDNISANEKLARKLIDIGMTLNITIDRLCEVANIEVPKLTDDECKAIASNYPHPFNDIKSTFGIKK